MSSYLADLAATVWEEIDQPTDVSIENIHGWFIANVGKLNSYLDTCFVAVDGTGISPEMTNRETAILAQLYKIKYYERMVSTNLGAGAYSISELRDGDTVIRTTSKTELAKTYKDIKAQEQGVLKDLVNAYKRDQSTPRGVFFN